MRHIGFGSILRQQRKVRGLTQVEVAEALEIAQSTYNALEMRGDMPSRNWITKLEAYFGLPDGYFDYVYDVGIEPTESNFDDREKRALITTLRALFRAYTRQNLSPDNHEIRDAITIAAFMWPDEYKSAQEEESC